MSDLRQQLLEDLRQQLPTTKPWMRERTERAIKGLEKELAGERGHALERIAGKDE